MDTPNANHHSSLNDPVWYFLAEYPLRELKVDRDIRAELAASSLFQTIRDLGIPAEHLNSIEFTLIGFAHKAMAHPHQGGLKFPLYLRLYCQKKAVDELILMKPLHHLTLEQPFESSPCIPHPDTERNGGWGYFLVERSAGFVPSASTRIYNLVDLYLYKEGE